MLNFISWKIFIVFVNFRAGCEHAFSDDLHSKLYQLINLNNVWWNEGYDNSWRPMFNESCDKYQAKN